MANTKKTTVPSVETIDSTPKVDSKAEALEQELAELKAQMAVMVQMMGNQPSTPQPVKAKERNITFINMTQGTLVLKGSTLWTIDGQFTKRTFLEREARLIVNNMPQTVRSGAVYITDAEFVEENELSEAYANLLTNEELETLLLKDSSFVVNAYKNASKTQKDIIIDMVVEKRLNSQSIDANVLMELGKLSGRDLIGVEPDDEKE